LELKRRGAISARLNQTRPPGSGPPLRWVAADPAPARAAAIRGRRRGCSSVRAAPGREASPARNPESSALSRMAFACAAPAPPVAVENLKAPPSIVRFAQPCTQQRMSESSTGALSCRCVGASVAFRALRAAWPRQAAPAPGTCKLLSRHKAACPSPLARRQAVRATALGTLFIPRSAGPPQSASGCSGHALLNTWHRRRTAACSPRGVLGRFARTPEIHRGQRSPFVFFPAP